MKLRHYPTEIASLWGGEPATVCPLPCPGDAGCGTQHGARRHWWGQHSSGCDACKEIWLRRHSHGLGNHVAASGIGPDHMDNSITYPIVITEDEIAGVVNSLQKLEADLA